MNKVIIINLNGNAYQLEESGFDALRAYLDLAGRRLGSNPDREEIIADIEQAIADKFRGLLGPNKTVVSSKEVEQVIAEMGPVQDPSDPAPDGPGAAAAAPPGPGPRAETTGAGAPHPKRLFKIADGAMIAGVCNGLAAYFNVDATLVRLAFALLTLFYGIGLLVYVIMAIILPPVTTSAEKSAAYGAPSTAQEFIRRAREGYYEGMKSFGDRAAHKAWRRKFKQDMRAWQRDFKQEIRGNVHGWQRNWHAYWGAHWRPASGAWLAVPLLTLLLVAIVLAGVASVVSLLATGSVFGFAFPAGVPVWAGVIILLIAFQVLTWPFKAIRHAFYYGGGPYGHPHGYFWSPLFTVAIVVLVVWYANHHSAEVHRALSQVRPELHQAVDAVRKWWDSP
jgi:phage shock protein PspC (stress-responsive transcriptional regulator)